LLQNAASPDFQTGVRAVIIEKTKGRPAWSPSTVAEVDDTDVALKFFGQYSPENGTAASIEIPADVEVDASKAGSPMRYALPTEAEIKLLVKGSHGTSGSSALTKDELVQKAVKLSKDKMGVREKILDVVARKCVEVTEDGDPVKYLRWKN
jgi:3-hydroxyisobutyryl-CoA hydrolase